MWLTKINKNYIVKEKCVRCVISLLSKAGSMQESDGKNGLAHLTEHISLAFRHLEEYSAFHFSGLTDFNHTQLHISFPVSEDLLAQCRIIYNNIINGVIGRNNELFTISQSEVLEECQNRSLGWGVQERIIPFLTNHQIGLLPVGKVCDVTNITNANVVDFVKEFYSTRYSAFIVQSPFSAEKINSVFGPHTLLDPVPELQNPQFFMNRQYCHSEPLRIQAPFQQDLLKIQVFWLEPFQKIDLPGKLMRMLFEELTREWLETEISTKMSQCKVSVIQKHITTFYRFTAFKIYSKEKISDKQLNSAISKLKAYSFSKNAVNHLVYQIKKQNSSYQHSADDVFSNIFANFLYSEPIIVTELQIRNAMEIMDKITSEDIDEYKCKMLELPPKIVFFD